jgi:N-acetylmuramoyl-L-alanine amidase
MAYGCGVPDFQDEHKDPESDRFYTDYAREQFGVYAEDYRHKSPNQCTLNIELCQLDAAGNFSDETLKAAAEYVKTLAGFYRLEIDTDHITTHHNVVGWKPCPLLWTNLPEKLGEFVDMVKGV